MRTSAPKPRRRAAGWLSAAAVLLLTAPALASVVRIGTFLEVGNGAIGEIHPDVAYSNKSNAYLVVWGDGGTGSRRPAYAQLISSAGAKVGARIELTSCGGELYGQRPRVAYSAGSTDDVFVVVYKEWCSGTVRLWAHIVKYSSNGAVSAERTLVRTTGVPTGIVYNPQRKEFVAVWEEIGSGTGYDAVARTLLLTRSGAAVTGFAPLPAPIPIGVFSKTQGRPRIALDPGSQSYLIAFQGENPTTGAIAMMYRTLDAATGGMSPLLYASQGSYNVEASVVYLPQADQFLIAWRQGTDIVGRRFAPVSGSPTSNVYPLIARPGTDGAAGAGYDVSTNVGIVAGMNSDYWVWASEFDSAGAWKATFRGSSAPPTPPGGGTFFPQLTGTGGGTIALTYGLDYKRVYFERFATDGSGGEPPPPPPPPPSPPASPSAEATAAEGDFTGDGAPDLVWRHSTGGLSVWRMSGLTAAQLVPIGPAVGPDWKIVGTGDLNGDGKPEVVWQHDDRWLLAWFVNGQSVSASVFLNPAQVDNVKWKIAALADVNGDKKADILWQHDDGWLAVWYMNGTTVASTAYMSPQSIADTSWRLVGAGDLNGDGKRDLVWRHSTSGVIGAWMMNGASAGSTVVLNPGQISLDWKIGAVVDLNADGKCDLVWQHKGGSVGVWLMNGATATSMVNLTPGAVSAGWTLVGPR